jgi:two-component system, cell cycle sensor histidine kinase and response regulator CckA
MKRQTYSLVSEQGRLRLHAMEHRLVRQRDALLSLTTERVAEGAEWPRALERVLEVASATLGVRRVGLWQFNHARTAVECVAQFDALTGRHSSGDTLAAADCPGYFRSLAFCEIAAVADAATDPRTAELDRIYLKPLGITSVLDVPVRGSGGMIGVLCLAHTGPARSWTDDEKSFAIGVCNLIALAFERCERRRAEAASLLHSAALNATAHAVVITDHQARVVWTNPAFTGLTGYAAAEALGRDLTELLGAEPHEHGSIADIWQTLWSGQIWRGELWNRRKDGTRVLVDQTITPVTDAAGAITHFIAVKVDLTRQRSLESQFLQAQKMEVVGRLSGGIAHDFNNMLTVINGTAELALSDLPQGHPLRQDFERIQESGLRAAALTRQLLTFSRKQIVRRTPIAVAPMLASVRNMLQRLIGEDITLEVRTDACSGAVLADQGQLEQIILNLAVNARDAMPRGGRLLIEAADIDLESARAGSTPAPRPGPHVRLSVADTGHGISPDVAARIFEPFFTTKEQGKGTGLGLATVHAIVEQSGGSIGVESEPGAGAMFTIWLPRVAASDDTPVERAPVNAAPATATILVVEDDEGVRALAVRILRSAGYHTLDARDAMDALQLLAMHPRPVDLIVTDVVLPGMGGRDLAAHAAEIAPGVPVLFTSGHTDDLVQAHGVRGHLVHFLGKPFTAASLCNKAGDILSLGRS